MAFPETLPDLADQEVGCREVTSAALTFPLLTGWVTADASAAHVSGAPGVLAVGVAGSEEEEADFFSGAAVSASSDVLEPVRAPPVLTTTPGSADRVARCDDPDGDVTWLIGDPVDLSVDPDAVDGDESDDPDTAAVPEVAAPVDDAPDDDA